MNEDEDQWMRAYYLGIWKLLGTTGLANGTTTFSVATQSDPRASAQVVANPESYFERIDRGRAIAGLSMRGAFGGEPALAPAKRLAAEIETIRIKRMKEVKPSAYLVVEGSIAVPPINAKLRFDNEAWSTCFDDAPRDALRTALRPFITALLTAATINLADGVTRDYALLGETFTLTEGEDETTAPIQCISVTGHAAGFLVASPFDAAAAERISRQAVRLVEGAGLERVSRLLNLSRDRQTDALQAFLAGWAALEIFVNKSFSGSYETRWFAQLEEAAPPSSAPVFERLRTVMRDKYRLADKFLVIATMLSADTAEADGLEFLRVKKIRDAMLHGDEVEPPYPTASIQTLLQTYLQLHLDS